MLPEMPICRIKATDSRLKSRLGWTVTDSDRAQSLHATVSRGATLVAKNPRESSSPSRESGDGSGASWPQVPPMRDRLFVHIVWTTRGREPAIDAAVARFLTRFLPAVARQERAGVCAGHGAHPRPPPAASTSDHEHLETAAAPEGGQLGAREPRRARRCPPAALGPGIQHRIGEPTRTRIRAGVRAAATGAPPARSDTRVERGV